MDFPFKGDEMALRNMEHAELITITTHNGEFVLIAGYCWLKRDIRPTFKD